MQPLGLFITVAAYVLLAAVFIRIIFSWTNFDPENPIAQVIQQITEPILAPIRSVMPRIGMFDLSPMAASFLLIILARLGQSLQSV
ncbi:MAG: YggT family protein [Chloroflexi bacterium]|nr:YggT family protein [Chloroflexota bacterium]MCI0782762.1 YggT family protein [Chloroflexota bacterium]MCI0815371.1 YggT family protein [Chloroflexota bacterium]MCI0816743.1 YggT family protein [Chloroflexota bacterium]MCI0819433.1 YggT family protein [Chloroflexota bacterium]